MNTMLEEYKFRQRHWCVSARFIYPDGKTETVLDYSYNTVVDGLSTLIACLIKGVQGYSGLMYWGVGTGLQTWSANDPPSPLESDSSLANEFYRKAISPSDIVFIDANDEVTANRTNRLQASVVFNKDEANANLMEFGIFGGDATATKNSGIMINHKTHELITKTSSVKLEYTIRLTF